MIKFVVDNNDSQIIESYNVDGKNLEIKFDFSANTQNIINICEDNEIPF